jgi:hypothetical protein
MISRSNGRRRCAYTLNVSSSRRLIVISINDFQIQRRLKCVPPILLPSGRTGCRGLRVGLPRVELKLLVQLRRCSLGSIAKVTLANTTRLFRCYTATAPVRHVKQFQQLWSRSFSQLNASIHFLCRGTRTSWTRSSLNVRSTIHFSVIRWSCAPLVVI